MATTPALGRPARSAPTPAWTTATPRALRRPLALRVGVGVFLALWILVAAFPLFWILVMSFKLPVDAFASDPLQVVLGPATRAAAGGLSPLDLALGALALVA